MEYFTDITGYSNEKRHGFLAVEGCEALPITLVSGAEPGPTVLITCGVHGGEYVGAQAGIRLGQLLQPRQIKGAVAIVHCASLSAFYARRAYINPSDGKNLNRSFPGNPHGTDTQRIAAAIDRQLMSRADYYIDLHGGDIHENLTPCVIYSTLGDEAVNAKSLAMASQMGLEYVLPSAFEGSTISNAAHRQIPAFLAELGGNGLWSEDEAAAYLDGVCNVLKWLDVLEGEKQDRAQRVALREGMFSQSAGHSGCWYPCVQRGDPVEQGAAIGQVRDFFGNVLEAHCADRDGIVCYVVSSLAIGAGDPLYALI